MKGPRPLDRERAASPDVAPPKCKPSKRKSTGRAPGSPPTWGHEERVELILKIAEWREKHPRLSIARAAKFITSRESGYQKYSPARLRVVFYEALADSCALEAVLQRKPGAAAFLGRNFHTTICEGAGDDVSTSDWQRAITNAGGPGSDTKTARRRSR